MKLKFIPVEIELSDFDGNDFILMSTQDFSANNDYDIEPWGTFD